jgi:glycerophosphoryl diester phosphodiesterase family protein
MNATPNLRPMSIGDLLDAAFRLYRRHFLTFIGIVALLQVPMAILQVLAQIPYTQALQRFTARPVVPRPGATFLDFFPLREMLPYYGLLIILTVVQYLVVYNLMTGALANAISRSYLGQPVSILSAYSLGGKRIMSLIAASLAPFLIGLALVLVGAGCVIAALSTIGVRSGESSNVALTIIAALGMFGLVLLLIAAALLVYVRLLLATQAIVLEGRGPLEGLTRSWRLVGQSFWRTLGIVLLVFAFAYIIALIVQLPVLAVFALSGAMFSNIMLYQIVNLLVAYLVLILILPLQFAIFTLLYYDLRVRKEGYDMEVLAQQTALT